MSVLRGGFSFLGHLSCVSPMRLGQTRPEVIFMKTEYTGPRRQQLVQKERPISDTCPVIDTDLGRDNLEINFPAAELEDSEERKWIP